MPALPPSPPSSPRSAAPPVLAQYTQPEPQLQPEPQSEPEPQPEPEPETVALLAPDTYVHVFDETTGETHVLCGPMQLPSTYGVTLHALEEPVAKLDVPPGHYVLVANPVVMEPGSSGSPAAACRSRDGSMYALAEGSIGELPCPGRPSPLVLYPGEELLSPAPVKQLVLSPRQALHVRTVDPTGLDADPFTGAARAVGEEFLVPGPRATRQPEDYYTGVVVVGVVDAVDVPDSAVAVRLENTITGEVRVERLAGSHTPGAPFLPTPPDSVLGFVSPFPFPGPDFVLHLRAAVAFEDAGGVARRAGEVFVAEPTASGQLVSDYVPEHGEELVRTVGLLELGPDEWCIVNDPYDADSKAPRLGASELRRGPLAFHLLPGESLATPPGVASVYNLDYGESLVLSADADVDGHAAGEVWVEHGPLVAYVPPLGVEVLDTRRAIDLAAHPFGVYVTDTRTGATARVALESAPDGQRSDPYFTPGPDQELAESPAHSVAASCPYATPVPAPYSVRGVALPDGAAVGIVSRATSKTRVVVGPADVALGYAEDLVELMVPIAEDGGRGEQREHATTYVARDVATLLDCGLPCMAEWISLTTPEGCQVNIHVVFTFGFELDSERLLALFAEPATWAATARRRLAGLIRPALTGIPFRKIVFDGEAAIHNALGGMPAVPDPTSALVIEDVRIAAFLGQDAESTVALHTLLQARTELDTAKLTAMTIASQRESQAAAAAAKIAALEAQIQQAAASFEAAAQTADAPATPSV